MKFGFDLHGVIDAKPELFSALTQALVKARHEVHILTGPSISTQVQKQLTEMGIAWTCLFSIVDELKYLENQGKLIRPMWQDERGDWWSDPYDWDRAKGDYCRRQKIDIHFDDSDHYHYFFTTPYCRFFSRDTHRVQKTKLPSLDSIASTLFQT